jgi:hypothetical protein
MKETPLMHEIMVEASRAGLRLWRNNVGLFNTDDGRKIRTGLCVGSSDLIGLAPMVVTQAMVGRRVAIFTAVEVKVKGRKAEGGQPAFLAAVKEAGGIAVVAHSVAEALEQIGGWEWEAMKK